MKSLNDKPTLEEVLDQFYYSTDKPSPNLVLQVCEAHPEYREDIMEFAALWSVYEVTPEQTNVESDSSVSEESVSRLQSLVLNRLHELDTNLVSDADIEAAELAVTGLAGAKLKRAAAAAGLGDSSLLLTKVLTQRISNTPRVVLKDLSRYLNVVETALQQCLGVRLAGGMSYKSTNKPSTPQMETWKSAVQALSVSTEEKERLLALQQEGDSQ